VTLAPDETWEGWLNAAALAGPRPITLLRQPPSASGEPRAGSKRRQRTFLTYFIQILLPLKRRTD
jgi:hypothetical protein